MEEPVRIRSGLSDFRLIDRISRTGRDEIEGVCTLTSGPVFTFIEALAQLGALHVRYLTGFTRHAFLLKVGRCTLPGGAPAAGACLLTGRQTAQSGTTFAYHLEAKREGVLLMEGEFLFTTIDYDERFAREALVRHYGMLFSCLTRDSKTA
ncbi:MAG: hypothetical protein ACYDAA_14310 [Syntrophales bacterium]